MSPIESIGGPNGCPPAEFPTTHWSVVLAAGEKVSSQSATALEKLCRIYWRPLYQFVRSKGHDSHAAQDLTQGFFERLLQRRDLEQVRREKGRFRSYLLTSLKNYMANEWHRERAQKRGGGVSFISIEASMAAEAQFASAPGSADTLSAESSFERRWALTVLENVMVRLQAEFGGDRDVFDHWRQTMSDLETRRSQASIATELGMSENALKQAFHRLRQRYQNLLRDELAQTVALPTEIDDELRYLITILRR
jgi:RNA polymerase sigma factor (sigma-70 family)